MTPQQLTTLKAAILAELDPAFVLLRQANDETGMAAWYNSPSTKTIWRSSVTQDEIMQNGFDWVRVDNLSVGKARIWEWLFDNSRASINPTKPNVRAGIAECWKGTAADLAVQSAVLGHCKRLASRVEGLFAVGAGTDLTPSVTSFEGSVTAQDISDALRA
jgi:hypothetical protein